MSERIEQLRRSLSDVALEINDLLTEHDRLRAEVERLRAELALHVAASNKAAEIWSQDIDRLRQREEATARIFYHYGVGDGMDDERGKWHVPYFSERWEKYQQRQKEGK